MNSGEKINKIIMKLDYAELQNELLFNQKNLYVILDA